jgi:TolB protein
VGIEGFTAPDPSALINVVRETLIDDLNNSGIFQVSTLSDSLSALKSPLFQRWKAAGATCYLEGVSGGLGTTVAVKLNDLMSGMTRLDAEYRIEKNRPWYTAHVIVDDMIQIYTGKRGSFASQISYIGPGGEVYTVDADGRGAHQLTFSKNMKLTTAWSPQGDRIAYSSMAGNWSIATINVNTGQSQMILRGGGMFISPSWGPSDQVAFSSNRDGNNEIYVARSNGTGIRRLTNSAGIDVSPAWAPDGSKIVFASDRESPARPVIYVMNGDGSDQHRLTAIPGSYEDSPNWSPRGDRIAFVIRAGMGGDVATAAPGGDDVVQLTVGEGLNENPKWSPDGLRIVFSSTRNGGKNLFIMNWDGTGVRPLTKAGNCHSPSWAPSASGDDIRIKKR